MTFGPQNYREALTFAVEELRAALQYEMLRALDEEGISQTALAERLNCSPAWVSQLLGDDANLTLESIAKVFLALGRRCVPSTEPSDYANLFLPKGADVGIGEWLQVGGDDLQRKSQRASICLEELLTALSGDRDAYIGPANDNYGNELEHEAA